MSPFDWALRAFRQYAVFTGRARRREFWWFVAFHFLAVIASTIVAGLVGSIFGQANNGAVIGYLFAFCASLVPSYAVMVRRLHDVGRSGWWYFIAFVPIIGIIAMLVWLCKNSVNDNRWGSNPKAHELNQSTSAVAYGG